MVAERPKNLRISESNGKNPTHSYVLFTFVFHRKTMAFARADFAARILRLDRKIVKAETYLQEKKFQAEPESIEFIIQHVQTNINRVKEYLPASIEEESRNVDYQPIIEATLKAEDLLLDLKVH